MAKRSNSELVRLALIYAIQDRDGMAESGAGYWSDEARELADEFRRYLKERYGQRTDSDAIEDVPTITLQDLMRQTGSETP